MKIPFLYISVFIMIFTAPMVFAQTDTNSDFNPFPQMEQDMNNTNDQAVAPAQQQNDDVWPPPSAGKGQNG
jgi:hypothetical protein